jgi:seryl-tRNA synthetase
MLDRDLIRHNPDLVRAGIRRKHLEEGVVDRFLTLDEEFRRITRETNDLQAEMNKIAKSIGALIGQGKKDEANEAKAQAAQLKDRVKTLEDLLRDVVGRLKEIELQFPNLPHESVPEGADETANVVIRSWGAAMPAESVPAHWEIAEKLKLLDLGRGAKISGSGFALYTGWGARLQRALFSYMVDHQTTINGYQEVYPPFLVNRASLIGTGNLPKFEEDLYKTNDDLYLIPTAEVPVTNIFRDEILEAGDLPTRFAAYSGCFRREAGAAGKDTRGLLRIHQFDKVELVKFVKPEDSYAELESLVADAESVLQALGLHYRVIELCAGDIGAKGCKCYDVEVWSPGVGRYLEISSCTNFEAYQSRRANIRFRREAESAPEFVHILNGSGLATPRLFAALVETYYQEDGSVLIPEPLRHYMGADRIPAN